MSTENVGGYILDVVTQLGHSQATMRHERSLISPFFIHGEACAIAGVDSMDLNNWVQRKVIDFGTTIVGRRVYSILDLVKLRVIGDLARTLTMKPTYAAAIAESVLPRATEVAALDSKGQLIHRHPDGDPQYLIAWVEPEADRFTVARTSSSRLSEAVAVPHPVIIVPLDEIALETTSKALELLDREKH
jgi:hypothetical protein